MKLTVEKANEFIAKYVEQVLVPSAKNILTLFKLGFARGANALKLTQEHLEDLRGIGLADETGLIDVDGLKKAVYSGLELSGSIPVKKLGITLERPDVDKFFRLVETGSIS